MVMPVMFITAQRQLWSENLRVAEGNPFTRLPQGFPLGFLIQDIDSNHSCLTPKLPIDLPFWQLLAGNIITATYIVIENTLLFSTCQFCKYFYNCITDIESQYMECTASFCSQMLNCECKKRKEKSNNVIILKHFSLMFWFLKTKILTNVIYVKHFLKTFPLWLAEISSRL